MVSKATIRQYGFVTLFDYFQYILESRINGNISSCRQLIMELSKPQSVDFLEWLSSEKKGVRDDNDYNFLTSLTLQILKS